MSCPAWDYKDGDQSGAFKDNGQGSAILPDTARVNYARKTNLDASASSSVFGKASSVQVASYQILTIIKI